jgi:predicted TIM-barrel fold metal-dependent hydrolase
VATALTYRRAVRALAELLGCEPSEEAVLGRRLAVPPGEWTSRLLRATGTEWMLVDTGYPAADTCFSWQELGELGGCRARPVLRLEQAGDEAPAAATSARERGYVALKTIAAYRGGLKRLPRLVLAALEANEATGAPLPVQVHCGFGDSDLLLQRADPSYLKPVLERFSATAFVLLHCWPFVREAGWLAHVYPHVHLDLGLTIPHVSRPAEALREALELAPVSKLLYSSDAVAPELAYLAALWWREALGEVLAEALPPEEAAAAGRAVLCDNALALYELTTPAPSGPSA